MVAKGVLAAVVGAEVRSGSFRLACLLARSCMVLVLQASYHLCDYYPRLTWLLGHLGQIPRRKSAGLLAEHCALSLGQQAFSLPGHHGAHPCHPSCMHIVRRFPYSSNTVRSYSLWLRPRRRRRKKRQSRIPLTDWHHHERSTIISLHLTVMLASGPTLGAEMRLPNRPKVSNSVCSETIGSRFPTKSSAPTSTVFCLSAEALFTRMGFPNRRTWFMILAAYSASSSLMNSTKP